MTWVGLMLELGYQWFSMWGLGTPRGPWGSFRGNNLCGCGVIPSSDRMFGHHGFHTLYVIKPLKSKIISDEGPWDKVVLNGGGLCQFRGPWCEKVWGNVKACRVKIRHAGTDDVIDIVTSSLTMQSWAIANRAGDATQQLNCIFDLQTSPCSMQA